jgi:hypothetical protein
MSKRGVRFIPRIKEPIEWLVKISMERGWHLKQAVARDPATGTNGEIIYLVPDTETFVILRDDLLPGIKFCSVVGPNQDRIAAEIRGEVEPWTDQELFAWWDRGVEKDDVDDRVDAVLFLGINTSEQPDDNYVSRICTGLHDPDKDVRNAAVAAAAYADWRVFKADLARIADTDPDGKARERARYVLDGWAQEDAGTSESAPS